MGTVMLALDRREDYRPLALKRVACGHVDARLLGVMRREFLILASLRHPHLPRVYDFGCDSRTGDVFFTSEYVRGISWDEATRDLDLGTPQGLEEFLSLLAQVLRTLGFVHLLAKVHGDIKPANVLVRPTPGKATSGQVTLIDFGLTRGERELNDRIVGTPYYVAPESITNSRVDRRGDLYSLGVVLYELATGQHPFSGRSNIELLKAHLEATPVPVRKLAPRVPVALAAIIEKLIEKRPEDRFQSAADVLTTLQKEFDRETPVETDGTLEAYLERGRWVATERGQRRLQRVLSRALRRTRDRGAGESVPARWVILEGSDTRRTRDLTRAFRQRAQARGTAFLEIEHAACSGAVKSESDGGAWSRLVRELCNYEDVFEGEERPEYIRQLASLPYTSTHGAETSAERLQERLVAAVRRLVEGSRKRPFVLHVHDVHLADPILMGFLEALLAVGTCRRGRDSRFLLCVSLSSSQRSGEVRVSVPSAATVIERLRKQHVPFEVAVPTLEERSLSRLLRRIFQGSDFPTALVRALDAECEGDLTAVMDTLRKLLHTQLLVRNSRGWSLSPACTVDDMSGHRGLRLAERIRALPRPAFHLGAAFACLGRGAPLAVAAELVEQSSIDSLNSLQVLLDSRLLRAETENSTETYQFARGSAREAYYAEIPDEQRRSLHRHAGQLYEDGAFEFQRGRATLAYHYLRANDPLKAVHYGLHAARELGRQFSPRRAMELYEQVLDVAAGNRSGRDDGAVPGLDLDSTVSREIANLRFQLGDFRGAAKCLDTLLQLEARKEPGSRQPLLFLEAARVFARLGRLDQAADCVRQAHRGGAAEFPLAFTRVELAYFRGDVRTSLRLGKRLLEADPRGVSPELLCELHLLLAEGHAELQDTETAVTYCRQGVKLLKGKEAAHLIALRHFCRAKLLGYVGRPADAVSTLRLSRRLWSRIGAREREASCLLESASLHVTLSRPRQAQRLLTRALERFVETGNQHGELRARFMLGEVSALLGDSEQCQSLLADTLRAASDASRVVWGERAALVFAGLAIDSGDLENAGRYLYEAVSDSDTRDRALHTARAGLLRGRLAFEQGEVGAALVEAKRAVRLADVSRDAGARRRAWLLFGLLQVAVDSETGYQRALEALGEAAKRDVAREGPATLLEGVWWTRHGEPERAKKAFTRALPVLKFGGEERDLALLHFEHGLLCLSQNDLEQAYVHLEEGVGLSRRLRLAHLRCRYFLALGVLELRLSDSDPRKAIDRFRFAHKRASEGSFGELIWQARVCLAGQLSQETTHAAVTAQEQSQQTPQQWLESARHGLGEVLGGLDGANRDGYLRMQEYTLGAGALARLLHSGDF
jgi:tetratricopeptide (TPR) repeat protein/tRNA A-37 threonylcarbamoyl transferase component Bud32